MNLKLCSRGSTTNIFFPKFKNTYISTSSSLLQYRKCVDNGLRHVDLFFHGGVILAAVLQHNEGTYYRHHMVHTGLPKFNSLIFIDFSSYQDRLSLTFNAIKLNRTYVRKGSSNYNDVFCVKIGPGALAGGVGRTPKNKKPSKHFNAQFRA